MTVRKPVLLPVPIGLTERQLERWCWVRWLVQTGRVSDWPGERDRRLPPEEDE